MDFEDEYEEDGIDFNEQTEINEYEEDEIEEPKSTSILDALKNGKKGMYFDEELVKGLIVDKYQPYLDYEINEKGNIVCTNRD